VDAARAEPARGGHAYRGCAGRAEVLFVALVDELHQPIERLSGFFDCRDQALAALEWLQQRHPGARLVREVTFRTVEA
jgi:hypothetical protein